MVAYDANCTPCRKFKCIIDILDIYQNIDFISLTKADKIGLLDQIPKSIRFKSFHLLSPNGKVSSGPEALLDLVRILPLGNSISKFIILTPVGIQITKVIYLMFSKLHDKGSCRFET